MPVTALLTEAETRPALERLVASAKQEILFSVRAFDPNLPLLSPELTSRGLETWSDLIALTSRRGMRLRALFGDRDPLFASDRHRRVWKHASHFADLVQGDAQIMCAQHGQRASAPWTWRLRKLTRPKLQELRAQNDVLLTPLQRAAAKGQRDFHPALLHQHFVLVDGQAGMLGGLGLGRAQDVSLLVEDADFTQSLAGHFAECWNRAIETRAVSLADRCVHLDTSVRVQGRSALRPLRTFTVPKMRFGRLAPLPRVTDHDRALAKLAESATKQIFIQTEALTCAKLTDALCVAAQRQKDLQLVLIVGTHSADSWDQDHTRFLQDTRITDLRRYFQDRIAVFQAKLPAGSVVISDDQIAIVGSANLTSRSLRWDCDVSAQIKDTATVGNLYNRLCQLWVHSPAQDLPEAKNWADAAKDTPLSAYPTGIQGQRQRTLPDDMF